MSATCIVFMCTKINCGRIRGSVESRIMYEIESRIDIEQPEHRANDLEPEPVMLDAIPILKSNQEAFSAIEDSQLQRKKSVTHHAEMRSHIYLSCIDI
ncbi:hypothetical protein Ahy_A02g007474 [Arachis hypogaea]|uniref:Uncharacterized protein n=1 Tax=Arachis hypogaea TaxID=3818 RepID=A0A445ECT2_ARAHY|nr:hypothetical protein Ahy_A02g007474 [Arachis hypogaea]